ncbi:unnamed protein product [Oikopleura dioica]|uniref:Uncharacterized protein n=1 Tax=Oikopleura dioica TaxID=34765 RepID=E4WSK1_OIKDI|nr:unnamed protein product [Oikopleura dioica]
MLLNNGFKSGKSCGVMEEGGVKTEPALSAEAFTLASRAVTAHLPLQVEENEQNAEALTGSELDQHSNTNTPIQAHGDASSSSRERSGSDDDLLDGVELLLEEKLEIAEFVKSNPETARTLVRENFTAKFGKQIDLDEIDTIIAMGKQKHGLCNWDQAGRKRDREKEGECVLLSDLMAFSGFNFQQRWRGANLDPRRGQNAP